MILNGTLVLQRILKSKKRNLSMEGSTGSSKTWSAIMLIILTCLRSPKPIVVRSFREDAVDCRAALGEDFRNIMQANLPHIWRGGEGYKESKNKYIFPNGSQYYFSGCDPKKLPGYRQDIAHLDETTNIGYHSYKQISIRTHTKMIYTFNPDLMDHWIYDVVMANTETCDHDHSTYKDNIENLTPETVQEIECSNPELGLPTADAWYWRVYGLGLRSRREGLMYNNWEKTTIWPEPTVSFKYGAGLDFGFTDPTTLVDCAVAHGYLYVRERIYKPGLVTLKAEATDKIPSLQQEMEDAGICKSQKIVADSAHPEQIASLKNIGYNVVGVKKGKVLDTIDLVKFYPMRIWHESSNILKEIQQYTVELKGLHHTLDAIRYFMIAESDKGKSANPKERLKHLNNLKFRTDFSRGRNYTRSIA